MFKRQRSRIDWRRVSTNRVDIDPHVNYRQCKPRKQIPRRSAFFPRLVKQAIWKMTIARSIRDWIQFGLFRPGQSSTPAHNDIFNLSPGQETIKNNRPGSIGRAGVQERTWGRGGKKGERDSQRELHLFPLYWVSARCELRCYFLKTPYREYFYKLISSPLFWPQRSLGFGSGSDVRGSVSNRWRFRIFVLLPTNYFEPNFFYRNLRKLLQGETNPEIIPS